MSQVQAGNDRRLRRAARLGLGLLVAVALLAGVWALLIEPRRLQVRHEALTLPAWPRALSGLRVVVLADLHVGAPGITLAHLDAVVDRSNQERPDLVVLLGDFVAHQVLGGRIVEPEAIAARLARLRARHGVVAVLGNHDWWYDGPRVLRALSGAGIAVLENAVRTLAAPELPLHIVGLADAMTREPLVAATLQRVPPGPVLVLTHNPDVFPEIPARVALTLAGHTHGGQVWVPLLGRPIVPSRFGQRYAAGHLVEGGRHLYVTTGIGTSILPVRLRVPPELVVLTLTAPRP